MRHAGQRAALSRLQRCEDWSGQTRGTSREGAEGSAAVRGPDDRRALRLRQRLSRPRLPEPASAVPAPVDDLALRAGPDRRDAGRARAAHRGRRRPGDGRRAARAHDRRAARQPPQPDASAVQLRAVPLTTPAGGFALRPFYRQELAGRRVLLADDVRNTGETFARCAALVQEAGGTVVATVEIYDRWKRSSISACRTSRWRNTGRPTTTRPTSARCARSGPDHAILDSGPAHSVRSGRPWSPGRSKLRPYLSISLDMTTDRCSARS